MHSLETLSPVWQEMHALAKFRCGVAPIRIESRQHYEQLALNDWKCILCQADSI